MTWKTLTDLLAREFRAIRCIPVVNFGFSSQPVTDAEELRREEAGTAERVNQLVRDFARTRRWPALDEKERFFLRERIRFAYEYAAIAEISARRPLALAKRPHIANAQRRILEWILIDVWSESGLENWLEPFYLLTNSNRRPETVSELEIAE
jgi:hypothetical protein